MRRSSDAIARVTAAGERPSRREAPARLLSSAAAMKAVNASIRSMGFSSHSRRLSEGDLHPFSAALYPQKELWWGGECLDHFRYRNNELRDTSILPLHTSR